MLIKKKLLELPIPEYPQSVKVKGREVVVQAAVDDGIYQLAMWREKRLEDRVFSDGKNVVNYNAETGCWNNSIINEYLTCLETDKSKKITKNIFAGYGSNSIQMLNHFRRSLASDRRYRTKENKYNRMLEKIRSFPEDPEGLGAYCRSNIFRKKFAILKKGGAKRKHENCICLQCDKPFTYPDRLKHKEVISCPLCGEQVQMVAERYMSTTREETDIAVMFRNEKNEILCRWETVGQIFTANGRAVYHKVPFRWEIHEEGGKAYRYYWGAASYEPADYREDRRGYKRIMTYVYAENLNEVFENDMPKSVDLSKLCLAGKVELKEMISNLRNDERARTLYKIGLYRLANESHCISFGEGDTFEDVLGINAKYYQTVKKLNIGIDTLRVMQSTQIHLTDKLIGKIAALTERHGYDYLSNLKEMQKYMGFERMINYLYKQKLLHPKTDTSTIAIWYLDYRRMSEELNAKLGAARQIDMKKSAFLMPRDIEAAHDGVSDKLAVIRDAGKNRIIKKIGKRLNRNKPFTYKNLMAVYPESIEDFVQEGATLHHCVGNGSYYKDGQADGSMLTIFIRRVDAPDKPYQTATFWVKENYRLKETYGLNHKVATNEIKEFIAAYQAYMRGTAAKLTA